MRRILCAIVFTLATSAAHAAEKVALLIGNSAYMHPAVAPLNNPVNDVRALARALTAHGFAVTALQDQTLAQVQRALRDFRRKADRAKTAMVFYAGHGIEIGGTNYLIPTDAQLDDERDAPVEAVSMDTVLRQISGASRLKMVVLDACRNNPFIARMLRRGATRSGGAGLAEAKARTGDTLIAYAAAPGETTPDGHPGGNSPCTRSLIDALGGETLDVRRLFGTARDNLRKSVPGAEPFLEPSLGGAEYLIQTSSQPATSQPAPTLVRDYKEEAIRLVSSFNDIWSMTNADALARLPSLYAMRVRYYGKLIPLSDVMKEKRNFVIRWPIRDYSFRPDRGASSCTASGRCQVRGLVEWRARNDSLGKSSTGVASVDIGVDLITGNMKIVSETSEVVSRTRSSN